MAVSELDTRLVMRPLSNTERVLKNAAVERLLEKGKALGRKIKFEGIPPEVAGVYPRIRGADAASGPIAPAVPASRISRKIDRWRLGCYTNQDAESLGTWSLQTFASDF